MAFPRIESVHFTDAPSSPRDVPRVPETFAWA